MAPARDLKISTVAEIVRAYSSHRVFFVSQLHEILEDRFGASISVEQLNAAFYTNASSRVDAYAEGLRGFAEIDADYTAGARICHLEPGELNKDLLLFEIRRCGAIQFPDLYTTCWKAYETELSLKNVNKILGTSANTIKNAFVEGFDGRVLIEENYPGRPYKITAVRVRPQEENEKWIAFLTLCAPIYESNLWEHAKIFLSSPPNHRKMNLETLREAIPELTAIMDISTGENLIFYPGHKRPKLSRDYLYYVFFEMVRRFEVVSFSTLRERLNARLGVDLDPQMMRRVFRSNKITAVDILMQKFNFPANVHTYRAEFENDVILKWIDESASIGREVVSVQTQTSKSSTDTSRKTNVVEDMIEFLHNHGGISLMVTDIQKVVQQMRPDQQPLHYDYDLALRSAELLTKMSSGRLELHKVNGLYPFLVGMDVEVREVAQNEI